MKDGFQVDYLHFFELLCIYLFNKWLHFASNLDEGNSLNTLLKEYRTLSLEILRSKLKSKLFQWSNEIHVMECNLN